MTGGEWDTYFKSLPKNKRDDLAKAFHILDNDPMFQKAYGRDFLALAGFIEYPLREEPTLGDLVPSGGT